MSAPANLGWGLVGAINTVRGVLEKVSQSSATLAHTWSHLNESLKVGLSFVSKCTDHTGEIHDMALHILKEANPTAPAAVLTLGPTTYQLRYDPVKHFLTSMQIGEIEGLIPHGDNTLDIHVFDGQTEAMIDDLCIITEGQISREAMQRILEEVQKHIAQDPNFGICLGSCYHMLELIVSGNYHSCAELLGAHLKAKQARSYYEVIHVLINYGRMPEVHRFVKECLPTNFNSQGLEEKFTKFLTKKYDRLIARHFFTPQGVPKPIFGKPNDTFSTLICNAIKCLGMRTLDQECGIIIHTTDMEEKTYHSIEIYQKPQSGEYYFLEPGFVFKSYTTLEELLQSVDCYLHGPLFKNHVFGIEVIILP
ncbi:MAG: hypothetical protein S4CHLAM102_07120 [Chlamydiia bacterium]|nr:hypothetical protein [Chlamydiia bacterium]